MTEKICTDRQRLKNRLQQMGSLGVDNSGQRNRLALTDADGQARKLLVSWMKADGLDVRVDQFGNIFGILAGTEPGEPVTAGSHIDTVKNAGMFDGTVGVIGGLEALHAIRAAGIKTRRPLAVVAFTNEEGPRFHMGVMGSTALCGEMTAEHIFAISDDDGRTVGAELDRLGWRGTDRVMPSAYIELHIEQGPRLDTNKLPLAAVDGIPGIVWWKVKFIGEANHAGSTPMDLRHDALLALSRLHLLLTGMAIKAGAVLTIGSVSVAPGATNIIPGEVNFTIDLRHPNQATLDRLRDESEHHIAECAAEAGLKTFVHCTECVPAVRFDSAMVQMVCDCAADRGLKFCRMTSGAGHDAQVLARHMPTAMIFVPSIGGKSHCPEELSNFEQISAGADVLLDCLLRQARV